ncbi:hypothetical protein LR48_Vigan04g138600 [Vigna angularis]|uniref:Uncharacterized protein n=1 Tax=Phaseolus angularis TaxID=3914 RepID=A0A0L9UEL7_PHAAN|nr:hypothetical protein LR48_Vigan04g138600 [Vigna angularis]
MRKNNQNIITLNVKIGVLTRELIEICQNPIFNEEVACGNDEEVGGGGHEAPAGGGDEEGDSGFDEQPGNDEVAHEDEKVSASHHPSVCIEIDDDGDDGEGEVVPLAIPPLRSFVGDPTTSVDVDQLYYAVSVRDNVHKVVCEIIGQTLSTTSCYTLAPTKYVDNMEELVGIRKKYVCEWILDNEKFRRMEVLAEYGRL